MKIFDSEVISKGFLSLCLQIQNLCRTQIVFQIIGRILYDSLVNGVQHSFIGVPKAL